jgi:hypothetical protein
MATPRTSDVGIFDIFVIGPPIRDSAAVSPAAHRPHALPSGRQAEARFRTAARIVSWLTPTSAVMARNRFVAASTRIGAA